MREFHSYLDIIARTNRLYHSDDSVTWLFHPGMLFLSRDKWWGDYRYRHTEHEGIDITFFSDGKEKIGQFSDRFKIPSFSDGRLIQICSDFLGQSMVVELPDRCSRYHRTVLVYAHVTPLTRMAAGVSIKKHEVIATACGTAKNPQLPPHLHLSCFEILKKIPAPEMNWSLFTSQRSFVRMINPFWL